MVKYDFMFYFDFKAKIDMIREIYSEAEAETFCMELIRYGVRRERKEEMDQYLEATIRTFYPLLERSREKKEQAAEELGIKPKKENQSKPVK